MSAGLSAEREAEIRQVVERRSWLNAGNARDLLAALDAERERRRRAEQQSEALAEAGETLLRCGFVVDDIPKGHRHVRALEDAIADYRAARDEAL